MNVELKQQTVGKTTYLVWNFDENLRVDAFAMNMLSYNHMTHIIPTQIVQNDGRKQIQFDITGLAKLSSIMAEVRPKQEVLQVFNSMLNAFEEAEVYMLDSDHLLLDWEYVYLDEQGNCRLIYLPLVQDIGIRDRIDFLREAVSRIKLDYQAKDTYLYDLLNAFSRGAVHTDSDFRELIKKSKSTGTLEGMCKKEPGAEEAGRAYTPHGDSSPAKQESLYRVEKSVQDRKSQGCSGIPVINIPERERGVKAAPQKQAKEKKNPFSIRIPAKPKEKTSKPQIMVSPEIKKPDRAGDTAGFSQHVQEQENTQREMYESDEGTVIMQAIPEIQGRNGEKEFLAPSSVRLVRKRNGASYPVDGNRVIVGSGTTADICIDNNSTISREHALISYIDGRYYVEDHQSRNGSFINGIRLRDGMREPIYNGMMIRLSNEEFEIIMN